MLKSNFKIFLAGISGLFFLSSFSQVSSLEINPDNEKKFSPFMYQRHGGPEGLAEFKQNHKHEYLKELWYYSESFYVKRNYLKEGYELDISAIDISRFENDRKTDEEAIILLPGFRDAFVLLPENKLIYKPSAIR